MRSRARRLATSIPDEFLAALHDLHALDGQTSVMGDPRAAIDACAEAGQAAKTLFATKPVTQAAIDTYNTHVGSIAEFLGHQGAIARGDGQRPLLIARPGTILAA